MNAKLKTVAATVCAAFCSLTFTACGQGKSVNLGKPAEVTSLTYEEMTDAGFTAFKEQVEKFACGFTANAYAEYGKRDNFAVSPVSVYMALSLASECAGGQTRQELLNALGVSNAQLTQYFPLLYRSLCVEREYDGKVISTLIPTNSVWVNEGAPVNQSCIDALSDYYFCYSYSADFLNDNASANLAVREFVKEQTKGLIDKNFELSKETLFTLINTLYLKTVWNNDGNDLSFTDKSYAFSNADGSVTTTRLLSGYYRAGRATRYDEFSTFYTSTNDGYKIKFIVPNDGYSLEDVFTEENISKANSAKYQTMDDDNKIIYNTRCLFPEYECSFDEKLNELLEREYGLNSLFDRYACDFSNFTPQQSFCSKVQHVTKLIVDKTGIEGAAVTVIENDGTSVAPDLYEYVYEDFVVDRAFGFVITDYSGVTLFSGTVNNI